jgi:hypothetical protein
MALNPIVGHEISNFTAQAQTGPITCHDYIDLRWTMIFSFPNGFQPVHSTVRPSPRAQATLNFRDGRPPGNWGRGEDDRRIRQPELQHPRGLHQLMYARRRHAAQNKFA